MSGNTTMSSAEVVRELIARACARDFAGMFDLAHADAVLALPTLLPKPAVFRGLAEVAAMNNAESGPTVDRKPPRLYDDLQARDLRVHQSTDPNVVIVAWDFVSHVDGHEVVHPNIQITRCRDGKMVHTTDYHTFVMRAVANGEVPKYLDMVEDMVLPEDRSGSRLLPRLARRKEPAPADSSTMGPAGVVLERIRRTSEGDVSGALELYADDIELMFPFTLPEPVVINGKSALIAALERAGMLGGAHPPRMYHDVEVRDVCAHDTTDPDVVVVEWTYVSRIGDSTVVNANIVVAECRDGKIVRSTDYHDHVTQAVANGEVPACLETIEGMMLPGDRT